MLQTLVIGLAVALTPVVVRKVEELLDEYYPPPEKKEEANGKEAVRQDEVLSTPRKAGKDTKSKNTKS